MVSMELRAPKRRDRVKGASYQTHLGKRKWLGMCWACEHGRRKEQCAHCTPVKICEHGRRKEKCKECGDSNNTVH